jgi:hypothetical protein
MNKLIDALNAQTEGIASVIMEPKDGLRDVVDELIGEIQGFREDLRVVAKAGGLQAGLTALFGRRK